MKKEVWELIGTALSVLVKLGFLGQFAAYIIAHW